MTTSHQDMRIAASRNYPSNGVELYGHIRHENDFTQLTFTKITMRECPRGSLTRPFAILDQAQATELMDDLWKAGIRPTEVGTHGELSATKYHLEDMRALAGVKK